MRDRIWEQVLPSKGSHDEDIFFALGPSFLLCLCEMREAHKDCLRDRHTRGRGGNIKYMRLYTRACSRSHVRVRVLLRLADVAITCLFLGELLLNMFAHSDNYLKEVRAIETLNPKPERCVCLCVCV
jgi:hypothetical protein